MKQYKYEEWQMELLSLYCNNNMKRLKKICYPLIIKKGVAQMEYDDLYSDALKVLDESVKSYQKNSNCPFESYLIGNIKRSFYDWTRDRLRWKRCNLEIDENGNIKRDKENMPIPIDNRSFDVDYSGNGELKDIIPSDYNLERTVIYDEKDVPDKITNYLNHLSKKQKKICLLIMEGYSKNEIKEYLHIDEKELNDQYSGLKRYDNVSLLF